MCNAQFSMFKYGTFVNLMTLPPTHLAKANDALCSTYRRRGSRHSYLPAHGSENQKQGGAEFFINFLLYKSHLNTGWLFIFMTLKTFPCRLNMRNNLPLEL